MKTPPLKDNTEAIITTIGPQQLSTGHWELTLVTSQGDAVTKRERLAGPDLRAVILERFKIEAERRFMR